MAVVYIYVALASYNTGYLTLPLTSIENIVDSAANVAVIDGKGRRRPGGSENMNSAAVTTVTMQPGGGVGSGGGAGGGGSGGGTGSQNTGMGVSLGVGRQEWEWRDVWSQGTDAVMDVPVGGVCEVLYGEGRRREQ